MELGSVTLKKIGFFWFPIKHSTHLSRKEGLRRQPRPGVDSNVSAWSRPSVCVFIPALTPFTRRFRLGFTLLVGLQIPFVVGIRSPDGLVVESSDSFSGVLGSIVLKKKKKIPKDDPNRIEHAKK